ncbi:hypothetical protein D0B54_18290 [Solimonas sp. K1W22B-7]|uniref:c-type cytochrome n=1 Tax=Solimonas sp. K1W22B-7 TaxID=2303331 RepID=UPI000E337734|nr:hypothetical protein [Solimonas sp. K1W22B-7]AXQ30509.1 hypothetical protein D0B54_18290 [Solimonas sp. K1W22B-7]
MIRKLTTLFAIGGALLVSACGDYSSRVESGTPTGGNGGGGTAAVKNCTELFAGRVQKRMDFCRTCHIPGGAADVPDGKLFQLTQDRSQDYANLRASWDRLGRNDNGKSRILKMASGTDTRSHTGGTPWPVGSDAYKEMDAQLLGFVDAGACAIGGLGGDPTAELPLLAEGHRGGSHFSRFCEGKADSAVLPPDPVRLIKPGVNAGKAVYFNTHWKDCHINNPETAQTCGEWRSRIEKGGEWLDVAGNRNAAGFFGGTSPTGLITFAASDYGNLWRHWGLPGRPDNFDQLLSERWGTPLAKKRNPYPLPGEDPNATNGGSGQLPVIATQLRNADGSFSGRMGLNCHVCHTGQVGLPGEKDPATQKELPGLLYSIGASLDLGVVAMDIAPGNPVAGAVLSSLAVSRGNHNSSQFQFVGIGASVQQPLELLLPVLSTFFVNVPASGVSESTLWWNHNHRAQQFAAGDIYGDATRATAAFFLPILDANPANLINAGAKSMVFDEAIDQDLSAWVTNLQSPEYPSTIDTALAEQGAILFHSKDLFAQAGNAGRRKPKGNGSCAGCHGAYSPRYVNDPAYLETPALEGMAGYIVPPEIIGTDLALLKAFPDAAKEASEDAWILSNEQKGTPDACAIATTPGKRIDPEEGYIAPPLYGVWASAPYFHNGSVPDVWSVLKSSDRPAIWRRVSTPNDSGSDIVMGFDMSFNRAYDKNKLGWNYDPVSPGYTADRPLSPIFRLDGLFKVLSLGYNGVLLVNNLPTALPPQLSNAQIEGRKVYDTREHSRSNAGHDFTDVLTDQERRALIEYLKTL